MCVNTHLSLCPQCDICVHMYTCCHMCTHRDTHVPTCMHTCHSHGFYTLNMCPNTCLCMCMPILFVYIHVCVYRHICAHLTHIFMHVCVPSMLLCKSVHKHTCAMCVFSPLVAHMCTELSVVHGRPTGLHCARVCCYLKTEPSASWNLLRFNYNSRMWLLPD